MKYKIWKRLDQQNINRGISYLKRNGIKETCFKMMERLHRDSTEENYDMASAADLPSAEEWQKQRYTNFTKNYKISILVPTFETPERFLREMLESVMNQSYDNWELCIADGSDSGNVKRIVMESVGICAKSAGADKIRYRKLEENKGISENTNAALRMASGDFIALLDHDDLLTPNALFEVVKAINEAAAAGNHVQALYSDEDKINHDASKYFDYHKKLDFNIDLLRSNNYICHLFVVNTEIARQTGGFLSRYNGAQDYDFILRCVEQIAGDTHKIGWTKKILHIPKVLYHWRSHEASTAENPESKLYAYEAGRMVVEDHLKRLGLKAIVMHTKHLGFYRVKYIAPHTKDVNMGMFTTEEWKEMGTEEKQSQPYDFIMLLSSSLKPIQADWKEELFSHIYRAEVGAVGGKIYTRKNQIESAGFTRDSDNGLIPDFKGLGRNYSGYLHRACLQRVTDGVDLDCIMLRKEALCFEKNLHLSGEYLTVFDPYAEFVRRK